MKKTFELKIFSVSLLISFLFLAGLTVLATKSKRQSPPVEIENRTQTILITAVSQYQRPASLMRDVDLTFQNNNPQSVMAYSVKIFNPQRKQGYFVDTYPFEGGRGIPSSQIFTGNYSAPEGYNLIKLVAVVFEDGTMEGDSLHANYLKGHWAGTREQYRLVLDTFRQVEINSSADALQLSESLKKGFVQLPDDPDEVPDKNSSRQAQKYFMGKSMGMTQVKSNLLAVLEGVTERPSGERIIAGNDELNTRLKRIHTERSRMEAVVHMKDMEKH